MIEFLCPEIKQTVDQLYCDSFSEGRGCKLRSCCTVYIDHKEVKE